MTNIGKSITANIDMLLKERNYKDVIKIITTKGFRRTFKRCYHVVEYCYDNNVNLSSCLEPLAEGVNPNRITDPFICAFRIFYSPDYVKVHSPILYKMMLPSSSGAGKRCISRMYVSAKIHDHTMTSRSIPNHADVSIDQRRDFSEKSISSTNHVGGDEKKCKPYDNNDSDVSNIIVGSILKTVHDTSMLPDRTRIHHESFYYLTPAKRSDLIRSLRYINEE